jgi:hypothetical protein
MVISHHPYWYPLNEKMSRRMMRVLVLMEKLALLVLLKRLTLRLLSMIGFHLLTLLITFVV